MSATDGADSAEGGTADGGGDGDGDGDGDPVGPTNKVDLLVVMDNSGSMTRKQAAVTQAVGALVQALIDDVAYDVRVAVTTTDNGNELCATSGINNTTPEGGALVASSCTTRELEFEWPHSGPAVLAYDDACLAGCPQAVGDALEIVPTTTEVDDAAAPRPWIEVASAEGGGTTSNIAGATWQQAVACMLPMGVDGCGFESQLESQFKAIGRAQTASEASYGFLRADAQLAVLHVTDEADCSANTAVDQLVFSITSSDSPFWTDAVPTSGICWNAGTKCTGSGTPYEDCISQSYNYLGEEVSEVYDNSAADEAQQLLYPVSRYIEQLESFARPPVVFVLGGVPDGFTEGTANLVYQENPATDSAFGIDFGCTLSVNGGDEPAVPPVRLREMSEAFATGFDLPNPGLGSICVDSYFPAMQNFGNRIVAAAGG